MKTKIKCKKCGDIFMDWPSNYRSYCSQECYHESKQFREMIKKVGFQKGHLGYSKGRPHIYFCNNNFFSQYNEQSCYWAGFIAADGNIRKNKGNEIKISLHEKDKNHLQKFLEHLKATYPLKELKAKNQFYIDISNKKLVDDLRTNFNITPKKSFTIQCPSQIPKEFNHHFIRGVTDGDGCWSKCNKGQWSLTITSGSCGFLKSIQKVLIKNCSVNKVNIYKVQRKHLISNLRYRGNKQIKRIVNYLYKDATVYLERKYINL
jgi:hypothetical protein